MLYQECEESVAVNVCYILLLLINYICASFCNPILSCYLTIKSVFFVRELTRILIDLRLDS